MSIFDKQDMTVKPDVACEFGLPECTFTSEYPGLWEFLARTQIQGNKRFPGKLVLFADGGKATVCLIDKTSGQVAFYTADGIDETLQGSDRALLDGSMPWRADKKATYRR